MSRDISTESKRYGEVPKFKGTAQHYPLWSQDMKTFLNGHKVGYLITYSDNEYQRKEQLVEKWYTEELDLIGKDVVSKSSSTSSSSDSFSAEKKTTLTKYIEASKSAYAWLYMALDEEHKLLVKSVPSGYAYGVWKILEQKYQNSGDTDTLLLWRDIYNARMAV